uniref:Zinc finger CCCH domain-containing protein 10 n=1 Tax=Mesocestoides corti TaxID=53468 RepID=A0A5K3FL32_MESCO
MQADAVVTKAPTKSADSCQNTVNADSDVCRDFLRNVCKRGRKCKFKHPTSSSSCDSSREPIFCHDYQNGACRRPSCKFLHYTKKEEEFFRLHGVVPPAHTFENPSLDASIPVCKDFLNHNCHRGSSCKFRHGKSISNLVAADTLADHPSRNPVVCLSQDHQVYSNLPNSLLQHQFPNNGAIPVSPPRTSQSAVTTPETTAMVAAAAAAGYLAMQKHGHQRQHQHNTGGQGPPAVTSLPTSALPPASAAAVAAAAAATALATTHQHQRQQDPLNQRYSEPALSATQSTTIPVMQSILGAVTYSNALHPPNSKDSAYPASSSLPTTDIPTEATCSYYKGNNVVRTCLTQSLFCVQQDDEAASPNEYRLPAASSHSVISTNFANLDAMKKPVTSCSGFNQHRQQQQDANTAAAVAAAACFGAMLSQPVAAAAAASRAVASKPTAEDILSQAVNGDRSLTSLPPSSSAIAAQSSATVALPSAPPPAPPPTAVAAAAAAAVAAAVVSSAGPSAAVAAMSAAHLATSSFSHAHPATHVSCAPAGTESPLTVSESQFVAHMTPTSVVDPLVISSHQRICGPTDARVEVYGPDEAVSIRRTVPPPPSPPSAMSTMPAATPSQLGSSAATAAYTATMTTAAAAAAMAAAVAVEEHNQKKNAAAAAMAAFNGSAALAHGVQSMPRIADQSPISPDSMSSSSHISKIKPSIGGAPDVYLKTKIALANGNVGSHRRMRCRRSMRQPHFPSAFDVVDDESFEESYYEDEEDDGDEITNAALTIRESDRKGLRPDRPGSPDYTFGRSLPIVDKPRQRSLSYPACNPRSGSTPYKEGDKLGRVDSSNPGRSSSSIPLSAHTSPITSSVVSSRPFIDCGIPSKRPKLVSPLSSNCVVSPPSSSKFARRRYHHFPRRIRRLDMESEMDVEDEEEDFCYEGATEYYSSTTVVTPPSYRERLHALKRENVQLRLHLQRVMQQRNHLQVENHALLKQNLKLRKFGGTSKRLNDCSNNLSVKPATPSFLSSETRRRFLQSPSCPKPPSSVSEDPRNS